MSGPPPVLDVAMGDKQQVSLEQARVRFRASSPPPGTLRQGRNRKQDRADRTKPEQQQQDRWEQEQDRRADSSEQERRGERRQLHDVLRRLQMLEELEHAKVLKELVRSVKCEWVHSSFFPGKKN